MVKENFYQGKTVLVLGLAKSGYQAAKLLHTLGAEVTVNDAKELKNNKDAQELQILGIKVISGGHPADLMEKSFDLVVKNPGIPYDNPVVFEALKQKVPVITEVEVATSVMESSIIGVTGTNGKTTTTSIIYEMLNQQRVSGTAYALGNIGVPASQMALSLKPIDDAVIELSSFQLMGTPTLKPNIAVLTNLYSAHLDYHGSQEAYEQAKMNIVVNQTSKDVTVYNKDQPHLEKLIKENSKAQLLPFSRKEYLENGTSVKEGQIYFKGEVVAKVSDIFIQGFHNLENMLAAVSVAKLKGVSNEEIQAVMHQFHGVKHRTQFVGKHKGRIFYNDSKATNIEATENALAGFHQPVILLAGGLDRGNSFDRLVPDFKKHVKALITFGQTADLMVEVAQKAGITQIKKVKDVTEAVPTAYALSAKDDIILLSPAAASWDQYDNFEIRGDTFIAAVQDLINADQKNL